MNIRHLFLRYFLLILSLLPGFHSVIVESSVSSGMEDGIIYKNYKSPTPGEIPIVASTVFNSVKGPQPGDIEGVEECGFNVCMDYGSSDRFEKLLGYMKGKNLKLLIQGDPFVYYGPGTKWRSTLPAFVNKFKNNPLVAGWKFSDEPKWKDIDELKMRYDMLEKIDPNSFIYINLVGQIAADFTGPCKTLPQYLDSIGKVFKMNVWSFDYYPIIVSKGVFYVNYEMFYSALNTFSKKSKETDTPMWSYLESMEYVMDNHSRPAATLPYLSFAAFSSLAYGAQGLLYWTYWQRPPAPTVEHLPALVNLEGKKMPAWYAAKRVNSDVKALTSVFLGCYMVECRHTGNIDMKNLHSSIHDFGPLESLTNGEKGVLVSHLKNGENNYLMLVNHDVEKKQKIRMRFKKGVRITELKASNSGDIKRKNVNDSYTITLDAGGYAVFQWE